MADAEESTEELSRSRSRSLSSLAHASKWRDKLREKAGKLKGTTQPSTEQQKSDVNEFLGMAAGDGDRRPMHLGLQIPTNDTLDPTSYAPVPTYHKRPARKSKGLNVSFSEKEPEIIGEGGDECEVPTQHVIGSWKGVTNVSVDPPPQKKSIELPASLASGSSQELLAPDRYDRRQSLQRAPTRKPTKGWEQRRLSMNMEEGLVQAKKIDDAPDKINAQILPPGPVSLEPPGSSSDLYDIGMPRKPSPRLDREPTLPQLSPPTGSPESPPAAAQPFKPSPKVYQAFDQSKSASSPPHSASTGGSPYQASKTEQMHLPQTASHSPPNQALPIRSNGETPLTYQSQAEHQDRAGIQGQEESDAFYSRVQHLRGVFRLAAEKAVDIESKALGQWLRMASWWFVRGKTSLEKNAKALAPNPMQTGSGGADQRSHQCYVDLAKAWWSVEDILPDLLGPHSNASISNKLDKLDGLDYPQLLGVFENLKTTLREFAITMHRRNLLPPPALLIQGADPCIWIPSPVLPQGILSLTQFLDPRTLTKQTKQAFFPIAVHDSDRHFCYGHVFAEAEVLTTRGSEADRIPCLISVLRQRSHSDIELTIVSQDGQINLNVQSDLSLGPLWSHVNWKPNEPVLSIPLSKDYRLEIRMWEGDFRWIIGLRKHSQQTESQWYPIESEEMLFDGTVPIFHLTGSAENISFPSTPVKNSAVRLFRRTTVMMDGATQRSLFDGYRLVARTSPAYRDLGCFNRVFAKKAPIFSSNLRGENEAPALLLVLRDGQIKTSLILTFEGVDQRSYFYMAVSGLLVSHGEVSSNEVPIINMSVADLFGETDRGTVTHTLSGAIHWNSVKVINEPHGEGLEHIMFSNHLRICSSSSLGTVVDLANLSTGELQISLEALDTKTIKLYRPAQDNLIVSFADNRFPKEEYSTLQAAIQTVNQRPTARVYKFSTLDALHGFQKLATGFDVIYDGLTTSFSISHRRNMIPLYKKQEATFARVQVLVHDNRGQKTFQLVAVLSDFPDGKIMNFQLRSTDVYEATSKSGKPCVRLIDAKFALPKHPDSKDMPWDFICLDNPDYPAEHDDILIGFDTDQGNPIGTFVGVAQQPWQSFYWCTNHGFFGLQQTFT